MVKRYRMLAVEDEKVWDLMQIPHLLYNKLPIPQEIVNMVLSAISGPSKILVSAVCSLVPNRDAYG